MMNESIKKSIIQTIEKARTGFFDEDFENDLLTMDDESDQTLDIHLVKAIGDIQKNEFFLPRLTDCSWRWEWKEIAQGNYPLDKLPAHVRDLAKVLYYQNQGKKSA